MKLTPPLREQPLRASGYWTQAWSAWLTSVGGFAGSQFVAGDAKFSFVAADPSEWLLCNGRTVSRTTYDQLFAAIGTVNGAGDGSTTFQLPTGPLTQPLLWIKT